MDGIRIGGVGRHISRAGVISVGCENDHSLLAIHPDNSDRWVCICVWVCGCVGVHVICVCVQVICAWGGWEWWACVYCNKGVTDSRGSKQLLMATKPVHHTRCSKYSCTVPLPHTMQTPHLVLRPISNTLTTVAKRTLV